MMYDAHKRELWRFARGLFLVGAAFMALAVVFPDSMRPDEYGARAYAIPAEIWALGFMSSSGLIIFGLHINGRKPLFTPLLRLVGIVALFCLFSFLAFSALSAKGGTAIVAFSLLFFDLYLLHFARVELAQLLNRWGLARHVSR